MFFRSNNAEAETSVLWPPHAKMGTIKDRDGINLKEAEDIKKRWQEYIEVLYRKNLHDPDNQRWCGYSPRARHPGT